MTYFFCVALQLVGDAGGAQSLITRDAIGVVVVLAPWNFPSDEVGITSIVSLSWKQLTVN